MVLVWITFLFSNTLFASVLCTCTCKSFVHVKDIYLHSDVGEAQTVWRSIGGGHHDHSTFKESGEQPLKDHGIGYVSHLGTHTGRQKNINIPRNTRRVSMAPWSI